MKFTLVILSAAKNLLRIQGYLFFIFIFLVSIVPLTDFDIYFHVKSGEVIAQKGIIHYDVFSHSTHGREWFPYEWLFQVIAYYTKQVFGFAAIRYLTAVVTTILIANIYFALRKIFNLNRFLSYFVCFSFFVSVYEFLTARPHIFAYTFLMINLNLILLYFIKNRNYLWLTIPITILWANLHGSIFLDVALFGAYAGLALAQTIDFRVFRHSLLSFPRKRESISTTYGSPIRSGMTSRDWFNKFKTLSLFTLLTAVLTILPPLWFTQYRLLWIFFINNSFISKYVDEWLPLDFYAFPFIFFSSVFCLILIFSLFMTFRSKSFKQALWAIPLLAFPILAYTASRNAFLGYLALSLILGWTLSKISFFNFSWRKIVFVTIIILIVLGNFWILSVKSKPKRLYYPILATEFIKKYRVLGNMFNEYGYGGYLLYHLYPKQKVFFDGRTDLYLCCEMRDNFDMALKKNKSDQEYKKYLDWFWSKYKISFVLVRTQKHSVLRKISRILTNDPSWNLVFWDDDAQLFVRRDGKNDHILKQFSTIAATPYNKDPFTKGMEKAAFLEYSRMIRVADSAKSRNAIGYILLRQKRFDEAKSQFERAIKINPNDESPYMNLAELAAKDQDISKAINLYQIARNLAPDRGLIYIRLGQLYLQANNDLDKAKTIWQEGVKNTVDTDAKKKIKELLSHI